METTTPLNSVPMNNTEMSTNNNNSSNNSDSNDNSGVNQIGDVAAAHVTANIANTAAISGVNVGNKINNNSSSNSGKSVILQNNLMSLGLNGSVGARQLPASSTAYSFTGSALGSGSRAYINGPITAATATVAATTASTDATTGTITGTGTAGNVNTIINNANKTSAENNETPRTDDSFFECNICLDTAKDAVVSMCGHLFCWPCLHQWLETRPSRKMCPVCKAAIDKDKVIPLYGRNSVNQEDPRNKVPPRPAGQRTEPDPQPGFQGFGFGDGFHMSFGIGAFPFGFFTSSLNFGEARPAAAHRGTTQYEDEQTLSKLFLYLAFMCIAWLLFA